MKNGNLRLYEGFGFELFLCRQVQKIPEDKTARGCSFGWVFQFQWQRRILAMVTLKNPTVGIWCNLRIHEWLHDSKGTKITADFGPTAART